MIRWPPRLLSPRVVRFTRNHGETPREPGCAWSCISAGHTHYGWCDAALFIAPPLFEVAMACQPSSAGNVDE